MGQVVKYKEWSVQTNYSVMSWRPKYPKLEVAEKYETESMPVMLSSPCGEKNPTAYWRMSVLDACLHRSTCASLMQSDVWSHTLALATMNNTLTVLMQLHNCVHTPYVKACVISAHFSSNVWKKIAALLRPPLFPQSLFRCLLCVFVLDDQAIGWSVCPHWPLCLGWRIFTNS